MSRYFEVRDARRLLHLGGGMPSAKGATIPLRQRVGIQHLVVNGRLSNAALSQLRSRIALFDAR